MDPLEEVLAHHGVKGMRWGVRKSRDSGSSSARTDVSIAIRKDGKKIKVSGGSGHPASDDALRTLAGRQIAKTSGTHALTNDDLQAVVKRMQLEQSYKQLLEKQPKSLRDKAVNLILDKGQQELLTLAKGDVGPIAGNLDAILASRSKGKHVIRTVGIVAPATGRHRK